MITNIPDTSQFQGDIDFQAIKNEGIPCVILKATEGYGFTDPKFHENRRDAHAAGLVVGMYHLARPDTGNLVNDEFNWFASQLDQLQELEFLVLDYEYTNGEDKGQYAKAFFDLVRAKYNGYNAILYIDQNYEKSANWADVWKNGPNGLWIKTNYDGTLDMPSTQWPNGPYFKQYTNAGHIGGVQTFVDLNVFYGDLNLLQSICYKTSQLPLPIIIPPSSTPTIQDLQNQIDALKKENAQLVSENAALTAKLNSQTKPSFSLKTFLSNLFK